MPQRVILTITCSPAVLDDVDDYADRILMSFAQLVERARPQP